MKDVVVKILEDKKIGHISVIDVRSKSSLFDYFIIGTIESGRQIDAVVDEFKKSRIEMHHIEKTDDNEWVLIDLFDIVVHLFSKQKRREYDLDSLWKSTVKTLEESENKD